MTTLRQKLIAEMQTQNLPGSIQKSYLEEVATLASHYGRSPDQLEPEQIRGYLWREALKLITPKIEALQFFYSEILGWEYDAERKALFPPATEPWSETDPLRRRMQEDMRLWRHAPSTRKEYDRWIGKLARHFGRSPRDLGPDQARDYLVHLMDVEQRSVSAYRIASAAMRFLYTKTLRRSWAPGSIPLPKREKTLPIVLSQDETVTYLEAANSIKDQAVTKTIYATGARTAELSRLKVSDIDSSRMVVRIDQGKGRKDRYVMLSPTLLEKLREYWRAERPKCWLFPGSSHDTPIAPDSVRRACRRTQKASGLSKKVTPRTLRHCFATHLLESGEKIERVSLLMGHRSIRTTMVYTHVATSTVCSGKSPLDLLPLT